MEFQALELGPIPAPLASSIMIGVAADALARDDEARAARHLADALEYWRNA